MELSYDFAVESNSTYDPFTVNWDKCIFLYSLHYREGGLVSTSNKGKCFEIHVACQNFSKRFIILQKSWQHDVDFISDTHYLYSAHNVLMGFLH